MRGICNYWRSVHRVHVVPAEKTDKLLEMMLEEDGLDFTKDGQCMLNV